LANPKSYSGANIPFQEWCRRGLDEEADKVIFDHISRQVREDDLEAFQLMSSNTKYTDLPEHLKRYRDDIFRDKYKRLPWDDLSRTITAHIARDGYWYIHPEQHRTLTVREAARLQTFPDHLRFAGFPSNAFHQIGESVPPLLGRALGVSVLQSLKGEVSQGLARVSTTLLSATLAEWIESTDEMNMVAPWRKEKTLWNVLLGLVLFERLNASVRKRHWTTYRRRWPSPQDYLGDEFRVDAVRALAQRNRYRLLDSIARSLSNANGRETDIGHIDGIPKETLQLAKIILGLAQIRKPTALGIRVAERVFGEDIGGSELNGQLFMARIFGSRHQGPAYAALLEVGEQFCLSTETHCRICPLDQLCYTGQGRSNDLESEPVL
jgi:DNA (cytosine-5)-methyltransferase 1